MLYFFPISSALDTSGSRVTMRVSDTVGCLYHLCGNIGGAPKGQSQCCVEGTISMLKRTFSMLKNTKSMPKAAMSMLEGTTSML